ncbi:hypothetical protein QOZ80_4AG0321870 [Eleusine coracana subsp. coracana]|nr:hypothetical protein QOZ80_4AG0321870 [Eleusine coracana subsp. coracana]
MGMREQHLFKISANALEPLHGHNFNMASTPWSFSIGHTKWESRWSVSYDDVSFRLLLLADGHTCDCESLDGRFKFSLLDRAGQPVPSRTQASSLQNWSNRGSWEWTCAKFITKGDRDRPEYVGDDHCFTVRCDVAIRPSAAAAGESVGAAVPSSDLHRHLGTLLAEKQGADVTFQMVAGGETFAAHRCVLAARSPVFRAQLFGHMKESKQCMGEDDVRVPIPIDDMDAEVFGALLTFIYTDSLPAEPDDNDDEVMARYQHFLAAADRYGLERMKLMCQEKLCKHIRASSVASMLALAERHCCRGLKEACFEFLSSGANLDSFTEADDGFDQLMGNCPAVLKELLAKLATVLIFE